MIPLVNSFAWLHAPLLSFLFILYILGSYRTIEVDCCSFDASDTKRRRPETTSTRHDVDVDTTSTSMSMSMSTILLVRIYASMVSFHTYPRPELQHRSRSHKQLFRRTKAISLCNCRTPTQAKSTHRVADHSVDTTTTTTTTVTGNDLIPLHTIRSNK